MKSSDCYFVHSFFFLCTCNVDSIKSKFINQTFVAIIVFTTWLVIIIVSHNFSITIYILFQLEFKRITRKK